MSLRLPPEAPVDLLMEGSVELLHEYALKRWNLASKLRRDHAELEKEIIRLESEALEAHWLIQHRAELIEYGRKIGLQATSVQLAGTMEPKRIKPGGKQKRAAAD